MCCLKMMVLSMRVEVRSLTSSGGKSNKELQAVVNRGLFCAPKSHLAKSGDIMLVKFRRCYWHLVAGG